MIYFPQENSLPTYTLGSNHRIPKIKDIFEKNKKVILEKPEVINSRIRISIEEVMNLSVVKFNRYIYADYYMPYLAKKDTIKKFVFQRINDVIKQNASNDIKVYRETTVYNDEEVEIDNSKDEILPGISLDLTMAYDRMINNLRLVSELMEKSRDERTLDIKSLVNLMDTAKKKPDFSHPKGKSEEFQKRFQKYNRVEMPHVILALMYYYHTLTVQVSQIDPPEGFIKGSDKFYRLVLRSNSSKDKGPFVRELDRLCEKFNLENDNEDEEFQYSSYTIAKDLYDVLFKYHKLSDNGHLPIINTKERFTFENYITTLDIIYSWCGGVERLKADYLALFNNYFDWFEDRNQLNPEEIVKNNSRLELANKLFKCHPIKRDIIAKINDEQRLNEYESQDRNFMLATMAMGAKEKVKVDRIFDKIKLPYLYQDPYGLAGDSLTQEKVINHFFKHKIIIGQLALEVKFTKDFVPEEYTFENISNRSTIINSSNIIVEIKKKLLQLVEEHSDKMVVFEDINEAKAKCLKQTNPLLGVGILGYHPVIEVTKEEEIISSDESIDSEEIKSRTIVESYIPTTKGYFVSVTDNLPYTLEYVETISEDNEKKGEFITNAIRFNK